MTDVFNVGGSTAAQKFKTRAEKHPGSKQVFIDQRNA